MSEDKYDSSQIGMDYRNRLDKEEIAQLKAQLKIAMEALENISGFIELNSGFDHPTTEAQIAKEALEQIKKGKLE